MRPQEIIRKKRDGVELSREDIASFVRGVVDGAWADYQSSALLMAVFLNGMTTAEMESLTQAMLGSGDVLDFSDVALPKADKHSTGGVGDKTSLVIAPLVAACGVAVSMISKKLAAGLGALVLDVKTGSGAFMRDEGRARALARALVRTGNSCGVHTEALLTDMSQPLGLAVGHAHEVQECVRIMRGEADDGARPVRDLSVELASRMVALSGVGGTLEEARASVERALDSGAALERFRHNVEEQGGDPRVCDDPSVLSDLTVEEVRVESVHAGYVVSIDAAEVGRAVASIGGGRARVEDRIDPAVGFLAHAKTGQLVASGEPLGLLYCRDASAAARAVERIRAAYRVGDEPPNRVPELIKEVIAQ